MNIFRLVISFITIPYIAIFNVAIASTLEQELPDIKTQNIVNPYVSMIMSFVDLLGKITENAAFWSILASVISIVLTNRYNKKIKAMDIEQAKYLKEKELKHQKEMIYLQSQSNFGYKLIEQKLNAYITAFNFIREVNYAGKQDLHILALWIYYVIPYCNNNTNEAIQKYLEKFSEVEKDILFLIFDNTMKYEERVNFYKESILKKLTPFISAIEYSMRSEVLEIYNKNTKIIYENDDIHQKFKDILDK